MTALQANIAGFAGMFCVVFAYAYQTVVFDDPEHPVECPAYDRDKLSPGATVGGPAIVWEYASTTVLLSGDVMTVAPDGELIVQIGVNAC